jgi:RNA polymerase sigma-70 factor (ECF subfamily)
LVDTQGEAELLRKAQSGGAEARDTLYSEYFALSKSVQGLLAREVPIPEDREDILHDAYLSLIRSKGEFRGDAKLQTFVYRVVQIAILQKLRSDRSRRRDKMVRLSFQVDGEERERAIPVEDLGYETVNATLAAQKLLAILPEPLRTVFRLRVNEELSYEEIARQMKTPINTVATRIFKARGILARVFGGPALPVEPIAIDAKKRAGLGNQ